MIRRVLFLCFALEAVPAATTTTAPGSVPDPMKPGSTCTGSNVMSMGGYVYDWPSKYDQVFWPFTDSDFLWTCPSGLTFLVGDGDLDPDELEALRPVVAAAPAAGGLPGRLRAAEKQYAARTLEPAERSRVLRALAYMWETEAKEPKEAARLRREAAAMTDAVLASSSDPQVQLEALFVAACYARWLGDESRAATRRAELDAKLRALADDDLGGYAGYLRELSATLPQVRPGGRLAPKGEEDE